MSSDIWGNFSKSWEQILRKKRNSGRPTIADVATKVGVSAISVSRAIKTPEKVSKDLLKRINQAIEEIGYVPDPNASALASKHSNVIGVLIPSLSNNVFDDVLRGIYDQVAGSAYHIQIGNYRYDKDEELRLIRLFIAQKPAALILTGIDQNEASIKLLKAANIPIIQMMDLNDKPIDMMVGFDQANGARQVAEHFADQNYQNVGLIAARMDPRVTRRVSAFKNALAGLSSAKCHEITSGSPSSVGLGKYLASEAMRKNEKLDAIFCLNDDLALGALSAATELGKRVPEDIAIAGYNDLEYMAVMEPGLTSVLTKRYEIGKLATELAIRSIKGEEIKEKIVDVGVHLNVRNSSLKHKK